MPEHKKLDLISFQFHPLELALYYLDEIVKGTVMCDILFYDEKKKQQVMKSRLNLVEKPEIVTVNFDNNLTKVEDLCSRKPGHYWFFNNKLAWRFGEYENLNFDLFAEPAVLLIVFDNPLKKALNEAIIFYFPTKLRNFRMIDSSGGNEISEGERNTIGKLLEATINTLKTIKTSDIHNWKEVALHYRDQELELLRLRSEAEKQQSDLSKDILKHCQVALDRVSKKTLVDCVFSDNLIEELKKLKKIPHNIYDDIKRAIKISRLKNDQNEQKTIMIDVTDLKITFETAEVAAAEDESLEVALRAPYSFLERIESAMHILDLQRKPFTGDNVGAYMVPDVTKSAITQYRNAHQESLRQLLNQYPDKWTLTRNYFKPIKYLLENQEIGQEMIRKKAN